MIWHYREFIRIQATHTYRAGVCTDVGFVIPSDTAAQLRRGRLLPRARPGVLTLLQGLNRAGAPLAPIETTLRFGVRLLNPHFANFTALDYDPHETLPVYRSAGFDEPLERSNEPLANYVNSTLWPLRPMAVVELALTAASHAQSVIQAWTLPFFARTDVLRYYVVAKGFDADDLDQLTVDDIGFSEAGRDKLLFGKRLPGQHDADPTATTLAANGESVVAFRSETPVLRSEKPLQKLQLCKNGDVVIPNLPQPGPENASADMIIHLATP